MRMPPADLPKPSFRKVDDELSRKPTTSVDARAYSFGYRNGKDFDRPLYYIRHTEPLDSDLMRQVEYDMDEQDHDWLQLLNADRKKEGVDPVSQEIFEVIMDQLEKEWFTLMKRVPKPDMDLPAEDSCCAVCDDGEGENANAIVFCDGCNLAVHQDCYGVPYIPEGQWLCRKCTVSPEVPVACLLCPNEGGAFKQTSGGKWAHLLCAIWIPEVSVQNSTFMEPIEHIENVSKSRWKLKCTLCKESKGACIQCDVKSCYAAFHVTCARKQKFLCSMKLMPGQEEQPLRAFCEKHLLRDMQETRDAYFKDLEERAEEIARIRKSNKAARAYARTYKTGPPLVPQYIVDRVMKYIIKVQLRKKTQVILSVCKYWSLKREARRGAPLLKRLHLEPWTTATSAAHQTEADRLRKLEYLERLRQNLINLRVLTNLIRDRETTKLQQTVNAVKVLSEMLFPHEDSLRNALSKISDMVKSEMPEYYQKITTSMCWVMIDEKLDAHQYWDPAAFVADVELVLNNAINCYPSDHELHRLAIRLKRQAAPILSSISNLPHLEGNGSPAAFEPALGAIEALLDMNESGSGNENQTLLNTLLSSLGDPNRPLVDALVKTQTKNAIIHQSQKQEQSLQLSPLAEVPVTQPLEPNGVEQQNDKSPVRSDAKLPKTPRVRDRKAEKERRMARLAAQAAEAAASTILPIGSTRRRNGPRDSRAAIQEPAKAILPDKVQVATEELPKQETQQMDVVADTASSTSSSRKRKRTEYEAPGLIPTVVDSVNKQDSFKRFETGWVLSEGARRTRAGTPQTNAPSATERSKEALPPTPTAAAPRTTRKSMTEVGTEEKRIRKRDKERLRRKQRAEERAARAAADAAAEVVQQEAVGAGAEDGANVNGEVKYAAPDMDAMTSSSLTDLDGDDEGGVEGGPVVPDETEPRQTRQSRPKQKEPRIQKRPDHSAVKVQVDEGTSEGKGRSKGKSNAAMLGDPPALNADGLIDGGTLVWAKQHGHPWFPGVIFEPDDDTIPQEIPATKEWFCADAKLDETETKQVQLVRFFDNVPSWAWLHPKSIRLLFDSKELDEYLLHQRQNQKRGNLRKEVRTAYERALQEKEEEAYEDRRNDTKPGLGEGAKDAPSVTAEGA